MQSFCYCMQNCKLINFYVEGILAMSQSHVRGCRELVIGPIYHFSFRNWYSAKKNGSLTNHLSEKCPEFPAKFYFFIEQFLKNILYLF